MFRYCHETSTGKCSIYRLCFCPNIERSFEPFMSLDTAMKPVQVEFVFTRVHCGRILPSLHTGPVKANEAGGRRHLPCHNGHASQNSRYRYSLSVLSLIGSPAVGSSVRRNCGFPSVENPELSQLFSL